MIIKPSYRGFICLTAHPVGCYKNVEDMIKAAVDHRVSGTAKIKNVVVLGSSTGYGLASRVVAAFSYGAKTVGVSFEKESTERRTATAGFYNNRAFGDLAEKAGLAYKTINGDAFSCEIKDDVVAACKELFSGEKVDLLIYSLAAPKRTDPETKQVYSSVIKPIGAAYRSKTADFHTGVVSEVEISPASEEEIESTIKVMGGEDWGLWVDRFIAEDLVADQFVTLAYSYIGPALTHAIYKDGTIGKAKDNLLQCCQTINQKLEPLGGNAYVSINKAVVTQASSAIPVVPLYISLLYKIMREKGLHEGCFEQISRLFTDRLYSGKDDFCDKERRIRLDDWEMRTDVQAEIDALWPRIDSENIDSLTDIKGYRDEFFSLFGFGRIDVDYEEDVKGF